VHAVIGTNGAGKSTLINILSGEIASAGGRVELLGQDVTGWSQPRRASAGLGRSYQRNTIYPSFTVFETAAWRRSRARRNRGLVARRAALRGQCASGAQGGQQGRAR